MTAHDRLLTPVEVAAIFRVDPKTVTRWAKAGRIPSIKTLGGHHRFREPRRRGADPRASDVSTEGVPGPMAPSPHPHLWPFASGKPKPRPPKPPKLPKPKSAKPLGHSGR